MNLNLYLKKSFFYLILGAFLLQYQFSNSEIFNAHTIVLIKNKDSNIIDGSSPDPYFLLNDAPIARINKVNSKTHLFKKLRHQSISNKEILKLKKMNSGYNNPYENINYIPKEKKIIETTISKLRSIKILSNAVYYSIDKGKEGFWHLDYNDSTSFDNTGTILVNHSLRIKRIFDTVVYMSWFGIKADGLTDNSVSLMKMQKALSGYNKPHYEIHAPQNGMILYSDNRFLYNIVSFDLYGHGSTFRSTYTGSNSNFRKPFWNGSLWQNNTMSFDGKSSYTNKNYQFNTVGAGAKSITCTNTTDAKNIKKGDRILIWGFDQVGKGFPPGVRFFEWKKVTDVDASKGIISLDSNLLYSYDASWWDRSGDGIVSGAFQGKPRITILTRDEFIYPSHAGFHDLTFGNTTNNQNGPAIFSAEELVVTHCVIEGYFWPSENKYAIYLSDLIKGEAEFDKIVGKVVCENDTFYSIVPGGGGIDEILLNNCQMHNSTYLCPKNLEIINCTLGSDQFPNPYRSALAPSDFRLPIHSISIQNLTFKSGPHSTSLFEISSAPYQSLKISSVTKNSIVIPFVSWPAEAGRIYSMEAGTTMLFNEDGSNGGLITKISYDSSFASGSGAFIIQGNWSAPSVGEVWRWSPVKIFIDHGNHRSLSGKPLFDGSTARFAGNKDTSSNHEMTLTQDDLKYATASKSFDIDLYGFIQSINIIVVDSAAGQKNPAVFELSDYDGKVSTSLIKIELSKIGTTLFDSSKINGKLQNRILSIDNLSCIQKLRINRLPFNAEINPNSQSIKPKFLIQIKWRSFN